MDITQMMGETINDENEHLLTSQTAYTIHTDKGETKI